MFYLNCLNIYIEPLEGLKTWNLRLIKKINNYVAEYEQRYIRERKGISFEYEDILTITKYDLQKLLIYVVIIYFKGTGSQIPIGVLWYCCLPQQCEFLKKYCTWGTRSCRSVVNDGLWDRGIKGTRVVSFSMLRDGCSWNYSGSMG